MVSLADSDLRVMNVVWRNGGQATAKQIHACLSEEAGYSRAATYSLIHRCIEKGALVREEPGFVCRAAVAQEDVQAQETERFIERVFDGSAKRLLAALVSREDVTLDEIEQLRKLVNKKG